MECQTFDLSAFHRAIWTIRERSRACGCVHTRQKLLGLERTLLSLLMKAERTKPEHTRPGLPPTPSSPPSMEVSLSGLPAMAPDAAPARTEVIPDHAPARPRTLRSIIRPAVRLDRAAAPHKRTRQVRLRTTAAGPAVPDQPHAAASDGTPA